MSRYWCMYNYISKLWSVSQLRHAWHEKSLCLLKYMVIEQSSGTKKLAEPDVSCTAYNIDRVWFSIDGLLSVKLHSLYQDKESDKKINVSLKYNSFKAIFLCRSLFQHVYVYMYFCRWKRKIRRFQIAMFVVVFYWLGRIIYVKAAQTLRDLCGTN